MLVVSHRILPFVVAALLGSSCALAEESRWEDDIRAFETDDLERAKAPSAPPVEVLFVGSSSIRLWPLAESFPNIECLNRGFGGSQMADAAEFADRILGKHQPRAVVIYSGDNDIAADKSPEEVRNDFQRLVKVIRKKLPKSRIVLVAIKPSLARWDRIESIRQANELLKKSCSEANNMAFIDVEPAMLGEDGLPRQELFVEDGLHLSPMGYRLWSELTAPQLNVAP